MDCFCFAESVFLVSGLIFVAFLAGFQVGLCDESVKFISWDDMRVDIQRGGLSVGENSNHSRVIVVDKDGGGHSVTVQGAIDMVPDNNSQRVKIYILPGIYREKITVPPSKPFISLIGNESEVSETVISWGDKASDKDSDGNELGTYNSASVTILSDYFCAAGVTFENSVVAIPGEKGMQAVALRIGGDKAMFYKVRILGTQDTLLDDIGSHYFYQCYIQGTVDFIFGRARSLYQNSVIHSIARNSGAIAAHHRDSPDENTGFSFMNCIVNGTGKIYLGRAWGSYSRIVYSYSFLDDIIVPSGWTDWNVPGRQKTAVFSEYQCWGKGANTSQRVPWLKSFSFGEVQPYLNMTFIDGNQWLRL
ncbi:hypothetical protein Patl1_03971 [Pistacia atlantica]|uniref:Uncharacterized protein n=1 Tax=Pistacia atlantica TaxID=434234 RepID=A0ACC1BUH7_9ROSI|nr:hypothetical protein Patl1_03971 [Pistacia atlantica]